MSFADHFSLQADRYAQFRPSYPQELYDFILQHTSRRDCAWDCATGNGQAAIALAPAFRRVEATDGSQRQIDHATPAPNVHYQVSKAEATPFPDNHFDLITVAQAIHWFDHNAFYAEVRRVARPGALVAVWGYTIPHIDPAVDKVFQRFYREITGPYWPPQRDHIDEAYANIPFPFEEIPSPGFSIKRTWQLDDIFGFFSTWSAVQRYIADKGEDPIEVISEEMTRAWAASPDPKTSRWPVFMKLGRVE